MSTAYEEALDDGFDKLLGALCLGLRVGVVDDQVAEIEFKIDLEGDIGGNEMVDRIGGEAPERL